jgi:ABC-type transport system involved in multi-copper enzyme maturation permease subunit
MTQAPVAATAAPAGDPAPPRAARRLSKPGRPRFPLLRVTWRQHYAALTLICSITAVAVGALVISGFRLRDIASQLGARVWQETVPGNFGPQYPDLAMQAIPLLIALFVGVQLTTREAEAGTGAFAWTQGYTKTRWLLGKLAAAAAVLVPPAVALGLVFGWWYRVYLPVTGYFSMHAFALYAPALTGWTLAGLTLGMMAGALSRREGRGMVLTVAGWAVLHRLITLGSPSTPASRFWTLQFAQLAILAALSMLFTSAAIWLVRDEPRVPGRSWLRSGLWPRWGAPERLQRALAAGRPKLAIARAAWRQHRAGLLAAGFALAAYIVVLLATGFHVHAEQPPPRFFADTGAAYVSHPTLNDSPGWALLLPLLIGASLGATLTAQDLGRGTASFAWVQGITRTRWITGKLIAVGLGLTAAAVAAGLVFAWWNQPYISARIADPAFSLYPPAFAGWTLACFTFAALLGALLRSRTGAAVICLLVSYVTAGWSGGYLRSHFFPAALAVNRPAPVGAYVRDWYPGKLNGQPITGAAARRAWNVFSHTDGAHIIQGLERLHVASIQAYLPVSRFWPLQAIETAGLLAVALVFGTATILVIRRRDV